MLFVLLWRLYQLVMCKYRKPELWSWDVFVWIQQKLEMKQNFFKTTSAKATTVKTVQKWKKRKHQFAPLSGKLKHLHCFSWLCLFPLCCRPLASGRRRKETYPGVTKQPYRVASLSIKKEEKRKHIIRNATSLERCHRS